MNPKPAPNRQPASPKPRSIRMKGGCPGAHHVRARQEFSYHPRPGHAIFAVIASGEVVLSSAVPFATGKSLEARRFLPMVHPSRLHPPPGFARSTVQACPGLRQGFQIESGVWAQRAHLAQGVSVPSLLAPYDSQHLLSIPPGPDGNVLDRSRVIGVHGQHLPWRHLGQGSADLPDRAAQPWHRDFQGAVGNWCRTGCGPGFRHGFRRTGGGGA